MRPAVGGHEQRGRAVRIARDVGGATAADDPGRGCAGFETAVGDERSGCCGGDRREKGEEDFLLHFDLCGSNRESSQ